MKPFKSFANGAELKELPPSQRDPSGGAHLATRCPIMIKGKRVGTVNVCVRYRPGYSSVHAYGTHQGKHVWGALHIDRDVSAEFHPNPECHHLFETFSYDDYID